MTSLHLAIKCQGPGLLLLDSTEDIVCEEIMDDRLEEQPIDAQLEPEISLHVLFDWSILRTMCITAKIG